MRQERLTPEESDELYGYRLRRLQARVRRLDRVRATDDENAIREAVDNLDARLAELRRFEESRRALGLSTGYEIDLWSRQAAIDRLLELAASRPAGLIAGSETAPEQPTGSIRLGDVSFEPAANDVPVYILAPPSIPSEALARNVEAVASQGAQVRLVHDVSEIQRDGDRAAAGDQLGRQPAATRRPGRPESARGCPHRLRPGRVAPPPRPAGAPHSCPPG